MYLASNLSSEVVPTVDPRREKPRLQQALQLETVVKDDDMWKELQQELAKSKVVSRAGVQEITRRFLERRESEIAAQAKIQSLANQRSNSPRRSSCNASNSRRSNMSYIAATGTNVRRALSMGVGLEAKEGTQKEKNASQTFFSRMNASMNALSVQTVFPAASRSRTCDDIFDVLDQASSDMDSFVDLGDPNMSSESFRIAKEEPSCRTMDTELESDHYQSCDDSDDELLVCFPSQPRSQRSKATKQPTAAVSAARTA